VNEPGVWSTLTSCRGESLVPPLKTSFRLPHGAMGASASSWAGLAVKRRLVSSGSNAERHLPPGFHHLVPADRNLPVSYRPPWWIKGVAPDLVERWQTLKMACPDARGINAIPSKPIRTLAAEPVKRIRKSAIQPIRHATLYGAVATLPREHHILIRLPALRSSSRSNGVRDASDMLFGDDDGQLAIQPDPNGLVKYHLPRLTKGSCQVGRGPNARPTREELITFPAPVMAHSAKHVLKGSDVD
jgi:hypothetical protein